MSIITMNFPLEQCDGVNNIRAIMFALQAIQFSVILLNFF